MTERRLQHRSRAVGENEATLRGQAGQRGGYLDKGREGEVGVAQRDQRR